MIRRRLFLALGFLFAATVILYRLAASTNLGDSSEPKIVSKSAPLVEQVPSVTRKIKESIKTTENLRKNSTLVQSPLALRPQALSAPRETQNRATLRGYVSVLDPTFFLETNCVTCSLVSSSGRILGRSRGNEIDQSDCVIRMNMAPTKGFEKDVGRKTSIRVLSQFSVPLAHKQLHVLSEEKLTHFVGWGNEGHLGPQSRNGQIMIDMAKLLADIRFYRSTPNYYNYQDKVFENATGRPRMQSGTWLTTGWFAFDVIKLACKRTKVFGMVPEDYCLNPNAPKALYHYWNPNDGDECHYYKGMENRRTAAHRFMTEKAIYARWALKHNITFHAPEWNPKEHLDAHHQF